MCCRMSRARGAGSSGAASAGSCGLARVAHLQSLRFHSTPDLRPSTLGCVRGNQGQEAHVCSGTGQVVVGSVSARRDRICCTAVDMLRSAKYKDE